MSNTDEGIARLGILWLLVYMQSSAVICRFGFIEFFTTTFQHSKLTLGKTGSMRMIDEDAVGLKEEPEDTRCIKKTTSK